MAKKTAYDMADWLGYLTREEVDIVKKLAKEIEGKNPVIVNIGAGAGTSGLAFAEARPDADLYTIDISKGGPLGGLLSERNAFKDADRMLPTQILGDSKAVGKEWKLKVDLLFIDGDHSAVGVRGDIESWLQHVKVGGVVIFHDYHEKKWGDVEKVVDELLSGYPDIAEVGRIKAFKNLAPKKEVVDTPVVETPVKKTTTRTRKPTAKKTTTRTRKATPKVD